MNGELDNMLRGMPGMPAEDPEAKARIDAELDVMLQGMPGIGAPMPTPVESSIGQEISDVVRTQMAKPDVQAKVIAGAAGVPIGAAVQRGLAPPRPTASTVARVQRALPMTQAASQSASQVAAEALAQQQSLVDAAMAERKAAAAALQQAAEQRAAAVAEAAKFGVSPPMPESQPRPPMPPKGGMGTFNYGKNVLGLTDFDAAQAVDYSKRPGGAWDVAKQVREAEAKIGPGWKMRPEVSNLLLPETMSQVPQTGRQLAEQRMMAALAQHEAAAKAAAAAQARWEGLSSSTPRSVTQAQSQAAKAAEKARLAQIEAQAIRGQIPSMMGRMMGPIAGGLSGAELVTAYQNLRDKKYLDALMAGMGGVGGLVGMVPHPVARGVGMAMAAPPLAYQAYKTFRGEEPTASSNTSQPIEPFQ